MLPCIKLMKLLISDYIHASNECLAYPEALKLPIITSGNRWLPLLLRGETGAYTPPAHGRNFNGLPVRRGIVGMLSMSNLPSRALRSEAVRRLPAPSILGGDPLYMLTLRFIAHLPYFKIACVMMLPQGLSAGGLLVAALVNALACLVASRWSAGLRRVAAELPHRAVLPLLGTTAVLLTMMVAGPVLTTLLPRHPELATDPAALIPAWFLIVAPVCLCFFAAQYLTAPRRPAV